ncbi:MAG: hypothetical protein RQ754_10185 [Desulfuromonadales bacterium]|nr:hypothetical protein [Desulfuromonadales bacterium]
MLQMILRNLYSAMPVLANRRFGVGCLLLLSLALSVAPPAQAGEFCSGEPFFGVVDGDAGYLIPTQITIDTDCNFQNFPQSNPLTATLNFQTNDPSIYLIVFDNVTFTGNMACANIEHKIWFANGSDYGSNNNCQDLFIPVETIHKQNPAGQTTAAIGVPFTYTLTLPSMNWPAGDPSNNDLHSIVLTDDLTETGVTLSYVSNTAYLVNGASTTSLGPLVPAATADARHIEFTFTDNPALALIPSGTQVVIEVTVVLDDAPANTPGTQFINTAKWSFGRAIDVDDDGVISPDEFFEPLPGEWGISEPLTIAEPDLVVTKSSDTTALNLVDSATFSIDVQNIGGGDAWNMTLLDRLPDIPGVTGMCPATVPAINAEIFAADGMTSISGPLLQGPGNDYSVSYDAASCEIFITLLDSSAAVIGPSQHLLVSYQAQLDTDTDPAADGIALTNVAGAVQWYNGDSSNADRRSFGSGFSALTDGTPGVPDAQDSETITTALSGYFFQKTVRNLTSGESPAATASAGDRLRYRLRLFNITEVINGITISDILDPASFDLNSFSMVSDLAAEGATHSFNNATGELYVSGSSASLDLVPPDELVIEFDITLDAGLANNQQVINQATLSANAGTLNTFSDDPYLKGIAPPGDPADPTTVLIQTPGSLQKTNTQPSATIGEQFSYRITVPQTPTAVPLYDVRILDDLGASTAGMNFISATVVSGGAWSLTNSGNGTTLIIEDTATGIDIPPGGQAVIDIRVEIENILSNQQGLSFHNSASYSYNRMNGNNATRTSVSADMSPAMVLTEPFVTVVKSAGFISPAGKQPDDPATVGDVLEYEVTLSNSGDSAAFDVTVADALPATVTLLTGSATAKINGVDVPGFIADPTVLPGGGLAWGQLNGDASLDIPAGQSLVLSYRVSVESVTGAFISNSVYVDWTSLNGSVAAERAGGGCPNMTAPDDYCAGPAVVSIETVDNTSISKAVIADSFTELPPSASLPVLRVGDTVTYELTLNLQEYTTRSVVVEDLLPDGLTLQGFTISAGPDFNYLVGAQPAAGATGTLRWEFGDIINTPSNDGTPIDQLVISYSASVIADALPAGVSTDVSVQRVNQARLSYANGDPAIAPERLTAAETIEIRQPDMSPISKLEISSGRTGSGSLSDPYQVNISSDIMTFRLSSCNHGLAPAYNLVVSDLLAPQLDEGDLLADPPVVRLGTTILAAGSDYAYTAPGRGGELRIALQDSVPVAENQCLSVDYSIGFHTDLTTSSSWSNQARLLEYRSLPGSGRLYAPGEVAQVWMTNLVNDEQLLKTLISSSEATIGEEVLYRITVPAVPMNAALDDVLVSDALPAVLEYVSASAVNREGAVVALNDNSVLPGQVSLGVPHIPSGEQVIITLTTRVLNNAQAASGNSFVNSAAYSFAGMPPDLDTTSTSGHLSIVEPSLTIAKAVTNLSRQDAAPRAGDLLRYSLTLTAAGGVSGDEFASAFDLGIVDALGLGLSYRSGTVSVDGAGNSITEPVITGDGSSTAQTLAWSPTDGTADINVAEGTSVTVTYDVLVLNDVLPGQQLTNSATVRWTGRDGDSAWERTGSGTPLENDYIDGPAETSLRVALAVAVVKSVENVTSGEVPGDTAEPGDTLRYAFTLSNESIVPLTNASLIDHLAAEFQPGSLQNIAVSDINADSGNSDPFGGNNASGLIDIRNLTLAAQGDPGDTLTVEFEATLRDVIRSGTDVLNQALLQGDYQTSVYSNEAVTRITSSPVFEVWKRSHDMSGDPEILMAGERLRYVLTIRNVGNENAVDVVLRDPVPANTSYLSGSTTLNGVALNDPAPGVSPLQEGLSVNTTGETAGTLLADPEQGAGHDATVTFEVLVDGTVMDGLVLENQGYLSGTGSGSGLRPEQPSDDPGTPVLLDPTRDVVGNLPLLATHKTVQITQDLGSPGRVDPGDTLLYTIEIMNFGSIPATGVELSDQVPANTSYVANSLLLNGGSVGPDGGVLPLIGGLLVESSDEPGNGSVSPDDSAVVTFEVMVDSGVPGGTLISNQGTVTSVELGDQLTDADGFPSNGYQPTVIVVGDAQLLAINKDVQVADDGVAIAGGELEYLIRVTNIGSLPATNVVIRDDLTSLSGVVTYVNNTGRLDGLPGGVDYAGGILNVNYAGLYGDLQPGSEAVLRFRVQIDPALAIGTTISNTAQVFWNNPVQSATAGISLDLGGTPDSGTLSGSVWHDANLNTLQDAETSLAGWSVELSSAGQRLSSTLTDSSGSYRLGGLIPNGGSAQSYEIYFTAPAAGLNTPALGVADSPFVNGPQHISGITVDAGTHVQNLNLPITPNGAVYDSVLRTPVAGVRLAMVNAATGTPLPASCFDDPAQQNQVTAQDGFYKFDLNFSDANCPSGGSYSIQVSPPANGYVAAPSQIIPPAGASTAPFSVPQCLGSADDTVPATVDYCEVNASPAIPPLSVLARTDGTLYHLDLTLADVLMPGQSQIFNNHIPVDPVLDGAVAISKTAALVNARRGDLVPYTITIRNLFAAPLYDIGILDRFPAGFKYLQGSARLDGIAREPVVNGMEMLWDTLDLQVNAEHTLQLLMIVGAGVSEGEYVNRAQIINTVTGAAASGEASASVRVVPDPTIDCTDVIGKVFNDRNLDGFQDADENGLPGVRVVTARGLIATTDQYGRFHIACAAVPDEDRGSNFIMKLDDRSLPGGYRVITENPRVQRATRGKMLRFNFAAALHRVVSLDISDGAFEPESTQLRLQWRSRIDRLMNVLQEAPSVLRLSYLGDVDAETLVKKRIAALKKQIAARWGQSAGNYRLTIESETFWRRGGPR